MLMLYDEHGAGGAMRLCTGEGKPAVVITGTDRFANDGDERVTGGALVVFDGEGKRLASLGKF